MNCKVCGSSEFVTNDGITYCTECQSQIEETQTEVSVEPVLSRDISSPLPKKSKSTEKGKKEFSDWISVECFNYILFKQVSDLIELGSSPKLKDTVLCIWSSYLQKCEVAFRVDYQARDGKPLLGPVPSKRDLSILYSKEKNSKRSKVKCETSSPEMSLNETSDKELDEPLTSDIDSGETSDSSVSSKTVYDKRRYSSSHTRKLFIKSKLKKTNKNYYYRKKVFNMTLTKTLSICYLGLLYTEDKLLLSDFIRNYEGKSQCWLCSTSLFPIIRHFEHLKLSLLMKLRLVYEEKILYVNVTDKLPPSMKYENPGDQGKFLTYTVPDAFTIYKTAHQIAQFIKLPNFREPSFYVAAARFVKDLNLPVDLLPIIKLINDKYKEKLSNWKNIPKLPSVPHEYQALASLIVAMKMLFILDDKFEKEHSEVMKKLNSICPDHKYFEWNEWRKHSVIKEYLFLSDEQSYTPVNKLDGLSADQIISKYPFTRLKLKPPEHLKNKRLKDSTPFKNNIIKELSDIVSIPNSCSSVPTSFPFKKSIKYLKEDWRTLPIYKETKEMDFTLLSEDFSSCSLLFDPSQYDKEKDELSYFLMTSLYSVEMLRNSETNDNFVSNINHDQKIRTSSKYWFLNPKTDAISDVVSDWFDKLPCSFRWLIIFFSKYAYCNNLMLYKEVVQIEKILFFKKRNLNSNTLAKQKHSYVDF